VLGGLFFFKEKTEEEEASNRSEMFLISMNKYLVAFAENTNIIIRN